jgi:hypothetical protein
MTLHANDVSASVGVLGTRAPRFLGAVLTSLFAVAVAAGLGVVLVPMGLTLPWLVALCGLVFLGWLVIGLRRAVLSVGLLELWLEDDPRYLVLRGPWATRRHTLDEVAAIQVWCDCGDTRPVFDPHRDGMEVLLHNGSSVRVQPGEAFWADVAVPLRELLEPLGVRVVDWGAADANRA